MIRYLSGTDLVDLVSPASLVAAVEQALRDFAAGAVAAPPRQHLEFGDNTLLTMPVATADMFGAKIVSIVPSNAARGVPVVNGLMVLSDGSTGAPLAVLDAAALTAQRTGAVGATGLRHTTPSDVDHIGIIGAGVQGAWQAIFACAVRPIRTIYFLASSDEKAQRFVSVVSRHAPSVTLSRCAAVEDLLARVEVVIAATTSRVPVVPAEPKLLQNKHFVSIGSFKPSMQELPDALYGLARKVVIDSDAARFEVGDLIGPIAAGVLREEDVFHLADCVTGTRSVDTRTTTIFKSVGMALYDLYAARAFLTAAQGCDRGTALPFSER
jgi:ornithine cyclodeaminase/alanine dehydrogenase-like protein (mu-crystallin family)